MTRDQILDKHTNKYMHTPVINAGVLINVKRSVGEAMEEYAQQKAVEFNIFYIDNKIKYLGRSIEYIWNEYQKVKSGGKNNEQ